MREDRCPVCGSGGTTEFLRRDSVPVHQHVARRSPEAAREAVRGGLAMVACGDCGFVFNALFQDGKVEYGEDYDNTQSHSPAFGAYLAEAAARLLNEGGVRGKRIVEIGCGKGLFLRLLVEDPGAGNVGTGFDTSYVGPGSLLDGRLRFERRVFDGRSAGGLADVVVCRHVIEHVSRPREVLEAAGRAVEGFPSARLYLETPCVEWILRNRVFWDFFYEHCSLFCEASLRTAVERSGFVVREVRHVFGGQYLWLEAEPGEASPRSGGERPGVAALCRGFAQDEARELARWRFRVEELWREGGVAIWGAGAKGTTFAHLLDPGRERIDCLVDVNPNKQGTFVAGTGHPIVPPEELAARGVRSAILMNPNYREESEGMLAALGVNVRLVE